MTTYRIETDAVENLVRRVMWRGSIIMAPAIVLGVVFGSRGATGAIDILIPVALVVVLMVFVLFWSARKQRALWKSIEIRLTEGTIVRTIEGYPQINVNRSDVAYVEDRDSGLVLRDAGRHPLLCVPRDLDGFAEIRATLSTWATVTRPTERLSSFALSLAASIAALALMGVVFVSDNPFLVVPFALLLTAGAVWAVYATRRSPHVDRTTKRNIWIVAFPVFAMFLKVLSIWR